MKPVSIQFWYDWEYNKHYMTFTYEDGHQDIIEIIRVPEGINRLGADKFNLVQARD